MYIELFRKTQAMYRMSAVGPYDKLYLSVPDNILWGDEPTHLMKKLTEEKTCGDVLEVGCGDGVNSIHLEKQGFSVSGFDISTVALNGLKNRFNRNGIFPLGDYILSDLNDPYEIVDEFDVIVSCGLYQCLERNSRIQTHRYIIDRARTDGIILFSSLTSDISLADNHLTEGLELPDISEIKELFSGLEIKYYREGIINDRHEPLVDEHKHSVIWILARKIT